MADQSGDPKTRSGLTTGLRLGGSLCLLTAAFVLVDPQAVLEHLSIVSGRTLALMTVLHILIILIVSWRFAIIAHATGASIGMKDALRLTFGSTLANMVLPTSLAGDAGRVWLVRRFGLTLKAAMGAGIFDRVVGLASLGAIVLLGALAEPSIVPLWIVVAICLVSVGIAGAIFAHWNRAESSSASSDGLLRPRGRAFIATIALSCAAHLISIAIAFSFLHGQGVTIGLAQLLVLFPAVLLAGSIPVSIGGWGTRELAAVGAFGAIGLAAPTAITMAFMFGVTQVVAAALGTAYFALHDAAKTADNG